MCRNTLRASFPALTILPTCLLRQGERRRAGSHRARRSWPLAALLLAALALPSPVSAQAPGLLPPLPTDERGALRNEKSPTTALYLSLATTGAGFALITAGGVWDRGPASNLASVTGWTLFAIGPNAGHFYAGENQRGVIQIAQRAGIAAVATGAAVPYFIFRWLGAGSDTRGWVWADRLVLSGYLAALYLPAIYGIVDSPRAARRQNRRARELQLLLAPAPLVGPDRSSGLGLTLGGRF